MGSQCPPGTCEYYVTDDSVDIAWGCLEAIEPLAPASCVSWLLVLAFVVMVAAPVFFIGISVERRRWVGDRRLKL